MDRLWQKIARLNRFSPNEISVEPTEQLWEQWIFSIVVGERAKLDLGIKCRQSYAGRFSPSYTLAYSVWPCEYVPAASVEDNEEEVKDNGLSSYSINTGFHN